MTIKLERIAYTPQGTFGRIHVGMQEVYTIERPWLDNWPSVSCVPVGMYELSPHSSTRYPETWALVGDTVSHFPDPAKPRSAILLHVGNTIADLSGCIAPGLDLGVINGAWAVLRSADAMNLLRQHIGGSNKRLEIVNYQTGGILP